MQADAHDDGERLVERLSEQDGLGLDAADAVAEDAQAADHRGVRIGAHERVREGHDLASECAAAAVLLAEADDVAEELEVDLVDDARAGRHDAEAAQGRLRPAQELVALLVALVLAGHVEGEGAGSPKRSTWTLWSMTRLAGTSGLMRAGSPPSAAIASRMAARSTTAGTPVKSWSRTRPGMKGISMSGLAPGCQAARAAMSASLAPPRRALAERVLEEHLDGEGQTVEAVADRIEAIDGSGDVAAAHPGTGTQGDGGGGRGHAASSDLGAAGVPLDVGA